MNSQPDNSERLKKLLALKRYEQPPPGYFENLSARIINRIELAEAGHQTWWQRLGFAFEFKPALVCAMGVVACGLFCAGVISAMQGTTANAVPATQLAFFDGDAKLPMIAAPEEARSSIEPVLTEVSGSPFSRVPARAERVNYTPGR